MQHLAGRMSKATPYLDDLIVDLERVYSGAVPTP